MKPVVLFVLLLFPALASIENMKITSSATPPQLHERIVFELYNDLNTNIASATFTLPFDASSIKVEDSYGPLEFSTQVVGESTRLEYKFSVPIKPGEARLVIVEYSTQQVLRQKNQEWEFLMVFQPTTSLTVEHTLDLPAGYNIASGRSVVSPSADIQTVNGRTRVVWRVQSAGGEPLVFIARFASLVNDVSLWIIGLGVLILFVIVFLFVIIKKGAGMVSKMKRLDAVKIVRDEDRSILEMVIKQPGVKQNDVQEALNWSKASVSKRVTNLIGQGLLVKKKRGRKNYLYSGPKL